MSESYEKAVLGLDEKQMDGIILKGISFHRYVSTLVLKIPRILHKNSLHSITLQRVYTQPPKIFLDIPKNDVMPTRYGLSIKLNARKKGLKAPTKLSLLGEY